jgi:hypothetical protein
MRNKRLAIIQKVNEERLFRNWSEFWQWYHRQAGIAGGNVFDRLDRSILPAKQKEKYLVPLKGSGNFMVYGDKRHITFSITIGTFNRKSGVYKINVLAVQKW